MNIIFASYGNDSVALIQWAKENNLEDVHVVYSDTGWAADWWGERLERLEAWVKTLGFLPHRTESMGMEELVKKRKGWPRNGMQFCTLELKIRPAMEWLDKNDPEKTALCLVGVRREESRSRATFPEYTESSPNHGGRPLRAPLVDYTEEMRDGILGRAGIEPLPHRSMECFPCINSNRADIRLLSADPERVDNIERIETELGYTSKGKPRLMFRPQNYMGATGIREVVKWGLSPRGKYNPDQDDTFECESGFCSI